MKHINCLVVGGLLLLGFLMMQPPLLSRSMVKLPGTINYFNNYLDTFGAKERDFLFYLDEILLFENMPDFGEMRAKLLQNVINPAKRRYLLPEVKMEYDKALRLTLTYKIKKILASYDKLNRYLFY